MFLHVGGNHLLMRSEIIGIFKIPSLQKDTKGRKFYNDLREGGRIEDISEGKPSSLILTDGGAMVSRISTMTLHLRGKSGIGESLAPSGGRT